jgi:hypothetical protein
MKSLCIGVNNHDVQGTPVMDHMQAIRPFSRVVEAVGFTLATGSLQMLSMRGRRANSPRAAEVLADEIAGARSVSIGRDTERVVEAQPQGADCLYVSVIARRLCTAVDEASIQIYLLTQRWSIDCHSSWKHIWRTR